MNEISDGILKEFLSEVLCGWSRDRRRSKSECCIGVVVKWVHIPIRLIRVRKPSDSILVDRRIQNKLIALLTDTILIMNTYIIIYIFHPNSCTICLQITIHNKSIDMIGRSIKVLLKYLEILWGSRERRREDQDCISNVSLFG